ncbi:MAG TPA: hypothetical protein VHH34_14705, partial [Pseudonocardiaceae bacterium]|nr:hypothetical protein [Pseudonocardiaceae bacterium]
MLPLAPTPNPSSPGIIVTTPNVTESCKTDALCSRVYELTDNQWLANSSYVIIVKPLRIIGIILIAMLIRWLLHRAIRRLATSTSRANMPALLKPLKERAQ